MLPFFFAALAWGAANDFPVPPNPNELAQAIKAFTGRDVATADVRRVSCSGFTEEPTEAVCKWQQRSGKRWHYLTYLAIDRRGWRLIDEPAPIR